MRAADAGGTARGSLRWIRAMVNDYPDILNGEISAACRLGPSEIQWVSPLAEDDYAEYGDHDFLDRVGISLPIRALAESRPAVGRAWTHC